MRPVSPESREEWEALRAELLKEIKFSSSIELLGTDAPLNPRIAPSQETDGVVVEKVAFESLPGYFVTGNLYRPADTSKKYPCVLNPHGHWDNGRLETVDRAMIPTRCFNFAKRGMVAFIYDMVGFCDSTQMPHEGFEDEYEKYNFGRFSVQLNNSVKAVDFVSSLPYVDKERIGCTGCSGGGTQTYFLTAIEPRIKAAAPINMASSTMQGGCICENTAFLRTRHCNTDFTMLASPRPLFLASCDGDWTYRSREVEFPAIGKIYGFYNAEDKFETFYRHAPHCYEKCTRELAYSFFCRAFGITDPFDGELDADIDLDKLLWGSLPECENAVKDEKDLFERVKKIIRANLEKLSADEKKELINRVFVTDEELPLDISYTVREDHGNTEVSFDACPDGVSRCGAKYYHTYNYADDTKRVNGILSLMKRYPDALFRASGKTAALCRIAAQLTENAELAVENADFSDVFIPGSGLIPIVTEE